jgi:hypothetical protein
MREFVTDRGLRMREKISRKDELTKTMIGIIASVACLGFCDSHGETEDDCDCDGENSGELHGDDYSLGREVECVRKGRI